MKALACLLALLLLFTALPAAAVTVPGYVEPVKALSIAPVSITRLTNQQAQLKWRVAPNSRAYLTPDFSSNNPQVATVSGSGLITTHKAGHALITATAEGLTATCDVTVKSAPVRGIALTAAFYGLHPGDTADIAIASLAPSYADADTLRFASDNPSAAAVDAQTGHVTAVGLGTARVTVSAVGSAATAVATVEVTDEIRVRTVLAQGVAVMSPGSTQTLSVAFEPANALSTDKALTFESLHPAVVTVDAQGVLTAHAPGKGQVRVVTANGCQTVFAVTVAKVYVKSVTLDANALLLKPGETKALAATILPSTASIRTATFASSNPRVASVSDSGVVTAVGAGRARITAKAGAQSDTATVTVYDNPQTVTLCAAGDITIGGDPRKLVTDPASEKYYELLYSRYAGRFLDGVASAFNGPNELSIANLESSFTQSSAYRAKSYVLRANPAYAHILADAGIDVVGHANNHAQDFASGMADTYRAVNAAGMRYAGNGKTVRLTTANGVTVAFCAFSLFDGTSVATVRNVVSNLARQNAVVVASFHWGTEFSYATSPLQRNFARTAVLAGADLVIGHHSHVVGCVETYKGRTIAYALGTLSSCLKTPKDMDTVILRQTFTVDPAIGIVSIENPTLVPCTMSGDENENDAQPEILSGADAARVLAKIAHYSR